jgi:hypothetical protein
MHENRDQLWETADDVDEKATAKLSKVLKVRSVAIVINCLFLLLKIQVGVRG